MVVIYCAEYDHGLRGLGSLSYEDTPGLRVRNIVVGRHRL